MTEPTADGYYPCKRVKRGKRWVMERLSEEPLPSVGMVLDWLYMNSHVDRLWDEGAYDEPGCFFHEGWGTVYFACADRAKTVGLPRRAKVK